MKENKLYIVMYHYVRDLKNSFYPEIKGLDYQLFQEQIEFFSKNFNAVTMEQVMEAVENQKRLPENAVLLTFDDGYMDHYRYVFPILKRYKMQGSFFMPARILAEKKVLDANKIHFILASTKMEYLLPEVFKKLDHYRQEGYEISSNETLFQKLAVANRWDTKETIFVKRLLQNELAEDLRRKITSELFEESVGVSEEAFSNELYLNIDHIKFMKEQGMYFGIHGFDHYWLGKIEESKMKEDIRKSVDYFAERGIIDRDNWVMNFPYGSYSEATIEYIKGIGCKLGLSVEARPVNLQKDNKFALPRFDTNDFPPKSERYCDINSLED